MDGSRRPGLLEVCRARIRVKHLSRRTEEAYLGWIRRFVQFHGRRHPREMGKAEVEAFLTDLRASGRSRPRRKTRRSERFFFCTGRSSAQSSAGSMESSG